MNKDAYIKVWGNKMRYFWYETDEPDETMKSILEDYYPFRDETGKRREPNTVGLIDRVVKKGDTVVDVGASVGFITLVLARLVGETGKVYSIEPIPKQVEYLKENIKINGFEDRVKVFNVAASDFNGKMTVNRNVAIPPEYPCSKLDDILPEKVDFIKMDIDGSEPRALKGLQKTFERNKNLKMIIEYLPQYVLMMDNSVEEMDNILNQYFKKEMAIDKNLYLTRK